MQEKMKEMKKRGEEMMGQGQGRAESEARERTEQGGQFAEEQRGKAEEKSSEARRKTKI